MYVAIHFLPFFKVFKMGIVASLASAPVTMEILKDEFRREKERKDDIK